MNNSINRYVLGIEYNGYSYHGWQRQHNLPTVQALTEKAISNVANHTINTWCAGRTDAQVHATQQVIHFDTTQHRPPTAWIRGSNSYLPNDIRILWAKQVSIDFNARFSAQKRSYHYIIANTTIAPALLAKNVTWYPYKLDIKYMQQAIQYLIGQHDFTSFRARNCQSKRTIRTITHMNILKKDDFICFTITANSFLHNMVRNILGMLLAIGRQKQPPIWAKQVLEAKRRSILHFTAPPHGLYLTGVEYPEKFNLPPLNLTHPLLQLFSTQP